jgi:nucleotide-binding universal stress UspA family protein
MFARILVPTDFSASSDAALAYARLLAHTFDSVLHVLHVSGERPPVDENDPRGEPVALRQIRERLAGEDRRRRVVVRVVERRSPGEAILDYARQAECDLVVMGTHGRTGLAHLIMGSVAELVVRSAHCPVFTVHAAARAAAPFTRILVPTDFSSSSDAALDCARGMQERCDAPIHLLHVLEEEETAGPFGAEVFVAEAPDVRAARLRDARDRLLHRITDADRRARRVTSEVLFGSTASTVVHYAADNGFDLIVMGTHGRTGLAHLLMGSVAERVIRTAMCPVITTHTDRPSATAAAGIRPEAAAVS